MSSLLIKPQERIKSVLLPKTKLTYVTDNDPLMRAMVINSLENLTGRRRLENVYDYLLDNYEQINTYFWQDALDRLEITVDFDEAQLAKIPQDGPVVIVANHPYGLVDGLIICHLAAKARGPFKVMVNSLLCGEPLIEDYVLPVNFDETKEAARETIQTKKKAMKTLSEGGTVVVFPAGGPSTSPRGMGMAFDMEWKLFTAKMIQMSKATVVPIYFVGQNSRMFQVFSQINYTLRRSLFLFELRRLRGKSVRAEVGDPIPFSDLAHIKSRQELLDHLRKSTYMLGNVEHSPVVNLRWE